MTSVDDRMKAEFTAAMRARHGSDRPGGDDVAGGGDGPHDPTMETRVALLEQLAKDTKDALAALRSDLKDMRSDSKSELKDMRSELKDTRADLKGELKELRDDVRGIRSNQWSTFMWLLGLMIAAACGLLATIAKGFRWL